MKTFFLSIVVLAALATAGALLYVRFGPVPAERWHADPLTAADPERTGVLIQPPDAPVFDAAPGDVMAAFDRVIGESPRTRLIGGSVEEGHATYLKRTRWIGFPDTTSVRVLPEGEGATVAILSRSRIGGYDWDVNRTRVERWLEAVRRDLGLS